MFNLIFMNFIVATSAFLLIKYFIYFKQITDYIITFFILFLSQIILTLQLLGITNLLYLKHAIILNLCILLIVYATIKTIGIKPKDNLYIKFRSAIDNLNFNKTQILLLSVILGFGLIKIFINLINPPFGWDDLNYHFTFPVEWMKIGRLDNPIVISDDPFPTYYPINGSLLFFWFMLPLKSVFLADLGQLPFLIISFLAVLSINRKLKLDREYPIFAASLFVFIPNFFKQLQIAYVDIMVAGIFLVAFTFILILREKFNLKNIIIFALSFGIFIGIKTTALFYSIFILMPFLYLVFSQKQVSFIKKIGYIILVSSIVFIFGCFSYFKNLILAGNPFYPLGITVFAKTIFKGVIDKTTFVYRNVKGGYSLAKLLFHEGLGIQSLLIILPGTILAPAVNIFKNRNKNLFLNYLMFLPILLYLTYRLILPIPNSRYLYPMMGIGIIVGFYVISSLSISIKIIRALTIISIVVSAFECARHQELIFSFILSFLLFFIFTVFLTSKRLRIITFSKGIAALSIVILFIILQLLFLDYKKNEYIRYVKNSRYWPDATKAWLWLNQNTKGNNIAYIGRPVPFPLYGTNFKNNVYYVSVNSNDPIHLHDLRDSVYRWDSPENMHENFCQPNNYRGNADYSVWLNNLHNRKTDFLFIYSLHHTKDIKFPLEEAWAKEHPDKFNLVFSNDTIMIYRINK